MRGWEITVTTDTEALVRRAYHLAEGDVLDIQGFIDLFAEDGVFNGIGGVSGPKSYRSELGLTTFFAQLGVLPDFASAVAASAAGDH